MRVYLPINIACFLGLVKGTVVAKSVLELTNEIEEGEAGQSPRKSTSMRRVDLPIGGFLTELLASTCNFWQGTLSREL